MTFGFWTKYSIKCSNPQDRENLIILFINNGLDFESNLNSVEIEFPTRIFSYVIVKPYTYSVDVYPYGATPLATKLEVVLEFISWLLQLKKTIQFEPKLFINKNLPPMTLTEARIFFKWKNSNLEKEQENSTPPF